MWLRWFGWRMGFGERVLCGDDWRLCFGAEGGGVVCVARNAQDAVGVEIASSLRSSQ